MTRIRPRLADAAKRAETWGKRAVVSAEVAAQVANPMAGPVAQQAGLVPVEPNVEMSQDIVLEHQKDWAENDVDQRARRAGGTEATREQEAPQMVRPGRAPSPERSKERSRER